ncbi:MAG: hypothetical protein AABX91_02205 [Nanoarchaeota archaeon]
MIKGGEKKFDEAGAEISLLNQLVKTLEDSFVKFKKAYERKDAEEFNKLKVLLIQTERRIFETVGI